MAVKQGASGKRYEEDKDKIRITYSDNSTRTVWKRDKSYAVTKKAMNEDTLSYRKTGKAGSSSVTASTAIKDMKTGKAVRGGAGVINEGENAKTITERADKAKALKKAKDSSAHAKEINKKVQQENVKQANNAALGVKRTLATAKDNFLPKASMMVTSAQDQANKYMQWQAGEMAKQTGQKAFTDQANALKAKAEEKGYRKKQEEQYAKITENMEKNAEKYGTDEQLGWGGKAASTITGGAISMLPAAAAFAVTKNPAVFRGVMGATGAAGYQTEAMGELKAKKDEATFGYYLSQLDMTPYENMSEKERKQAIMEGYEQFKAQNPQLLELTDEEMSDLQKYADVGGVVSAMTDKLFRGAGIVTKKSMPFMEKGMGALSKGVASKMGTGAGKVAREVGEYLGEGAEEIVENMIMDPVARATYNPQHENTSLQENLLEGGTAALISAVMGGGKYLGSNILSTAKQDMSTAEGKRLDEFVKAQDKPDIERTPREKQIVNEVKAQENNVKVQEAVQQAQAVATDYADTYSKMDINSLQNEISELPRARDNGAISENEYNIRMNMAQAEVAGKIGQAQAQQEAQTGKVKIDPSEIQNESIRNAISGFKADVFIDTSTGEISVEGTTTKAMRNRMREAGFVQNPETKAWTINENYVPQQEVVQEPQPQPTQSPQQETVVEQNAMPTVSPSEATNTMPSATPSAMHVEGADIAPRAVENIQQTNPVEEQNTTPVLEQPSALQTAKETKKPKATKKKKLDPNSREYLLAEMAEQQAQVEQMNREANEEKMRRMKEESGKTERISETPFVPPMSDEAYAELEAKIDAAAERGDTVEFEKLVAQVPSNRMPQEVMRTKEMLVNEDEDPFLWDSEDTGGYYNYNAPELWELDPYFEKFKGTKDHEKYMDLMDEYNSIGKQMTMLNMSDFPHDHEEYVSLNERHDELSRQLTELQDKFRKYYESDEYPDSNIEEEQDVYETEEDDPEFNGYDEDEDYETGGIGDEADEDYLEIEVPEGETAVSELVTNTLANNTDEVTEEMVKDIIESGAGDYYVRHNEDTFKRVAERLQNINKEESDLLNGSISDVDDIETAYQIIRIRAQEGDTQAVIRMARVLSEEVSRNAQNLQILSAHSKHTTEGIVMSHQNAMRGYEKNQKGDPEKGTTPSKKWRKVEKEADGATEAVHEAEETAAQEAQSALNKAIEKFDASVKAKQKPNRPRTEKDDIADLAANTADRAVDMTDPTLEPKNTPSKITLANEILQALQENGMPNFRADRKRPSSRLDTLKYVYEHQGEMQEVFDTARAFINERYKSDPEALEIANEYFNEGTIPSYSEKTVENAIREVAELSKIDFKGLIYRCKGNRDRAGRLIAKAIAEHIGARPTYDGQGNMVMPEEATQLAKDVLDVYNRVLEREAKAKLAQMFPKNPIDKVLPKKGNATFGKILDLVNLGAYEDADIVDIIKEKNGIPVLNAEDVAKISDYVDIARQNDIGSRPYNENMYKAMQIAFNKLPKTIQDATSQGKRIIMLANLKTVIKNGTANVPFGIEETLNSPIAGTIDAATSKVMGTPRTRTVNPHVGAGLKGFANGARDFALDVKSGTNTYRMGDGAVTQFELPRAKVFGNNDVGVFMPVDKALGLLEDWVSYSMRSGDQPFYESHKERMLANLKDLGYDIENPNIKEIAGNYAKEVVFQDNSKLSDAAIDLREGLNKMGDGMFGGWFPFKLGDFVITFAQTPANIADRMIDMHPVLGTTRALLDNGGLLRRDTAFDQQKFVTRMARMFTGSTIMGLSYGLAAAGVITGSAPEDNDERNAKYLTGWRPMSFHIGDKYYDYSFMLPISAFMTIGADTYAEGLGTETLNFIIDDLAMMKDADLSASERAELLGDAARRLPTFVQETAPATLNIKSGVNCILNNSFLKSIEELLGGYGDSTADNILNAAQDFPGQYVSGPINALGNITDEYQRETYDPNPLVQTKNKVQSKVPFWREQLPVKRDVYAREMKTNQGRDLKSRILENMVIPSNITEKTADKVNDEMIRLGEATGETNHYFEKPKKYIEFGSEKVALNATQWNEYIEKSNGKAYGMVSELMELNAYKNMTDDEKLSVIGEVKTYCKSSAKYEMGKALGKDAAEPDDNPLEKYREYDRIGMTNDMIETVKEIRKQDEGSGVTKRTMAAFRKTGNYTQEQLDYIEGLVKSKGNSWRKEAQ